MDFREREQLRERDVRRTGVPAAPTEHAVLQVVLVHLVVPFVQCELPQDLGIQEHRARIQAVPAPDARVGLLRLDLRVGEDDDAAGSLEHRQKRPISTNTTRLRPTTVKQKDH